VTIRSSGDPAGTGFDQLVDVGRADTVKGVNPYAGQSINQWINPAALTSPVDIIGRYANSSVGNVTGPSTKSVRYRCSRPTSSNLFNHPNALRTAEGAGPRQIQLTARIYF
jgi:hypothetical protein